VQQSDQPTTIAWNTTASVLYPAGHPYAAPLIGDEASVKRAGRAELVKAYEATMGPEDAVIGFAGDVSLDDAKREAERVLGDWKSHQKKRDTKVDVVPPLPSARKAALKIVFVERPGATQSLVVIGSVGAPRKGPDFEALLVMNTVLGGHFSSRLNMNLREKHAYTYGVRSGFDMRLGPGPFTAGGAIETKATAPAIKEALSEVERIRAEDVTDEELATAKKYLIGQLPARFESSAETAGTITALATYDLGLDEFARRAERVSAIQPADVRRVAEKYLGAEGEWVVVVGDPSVLPDLEALGFGKPEVRKAPPKAKPKPSAGTAAPPKK
ncbi:MAG TPA: pitrilysin family protein, partial [Polyangiaceae bacterium]|nr:pitrilysin family protein [Polyangiaceae bacterium]